MWMHIFGIQYYKHEEFSTRATVEISGTRESDTSKQQFQLAIDTKKELENSLLADLSSFERYTKNLRNKWG